MDVNGIEGFWSYAKGRLLKYQGVGKNNLFDGTMDKLTYKKNYK